MEAATLAAEHDEEFHIPERARAAGVLVADEPQPTPAPDPTPAPQPATPTRDCRHCGEPFPVQGEGQWRYCSHACRTAARPPAPPAKGSMRDRPHRTLLGSK
ncbi:hypothetical protein [Micromonospora rifamycinica]|uniref:hypothetical protein n=1 Tax=Micromonospora rifamycinica TaxID=291594 RepID=UPI0012FAF672|nr:hypothetical protein [Micromonospora rifamycinica]